MEDALVQSAMAEIAMWDAFAAGRTANATGFLAIVLAVWVAARFSSVSLEKNVNMLGKVFVTAFAVGVFLSGLVVYGNIVEEFGIDIPDEDAEKMSSVGDAIKYLEENSKS